jgi:hypothetical protein
MSISSSPEKRHIAISMADKLYMGKGHPFNAFTFYLLASAGLVRDM